MEFLVLTTLLLEPLLMLLIFVMYLLLVLPLKLVFQVFEFDFNDDSSSVVVSAKVSGYEFLTNGQSDIFYGTRQYTVERQTNGDFLVSSIVALRTAKFNQ